MRWEAPADVAERVMREHFLRIRPKLVSLLRDKPGLCAEVNRETVLAVLREWALAAVPAKCFRRKEFIEGMNRAIEQDLAEAIKEAGK